MTMKTHNSKPRCTKNSAKSGKFIAIEAYLKEQEKQQINNLILHLKQLEK